MTEIKNVFVTVAMPARDLLGKLEEGFYLVEKDTVHLVTSTGRPRLGRMGKPLTRKLAPGEDAKTAAYRLTRENMPNRRDNFNRKLNYPNLGKI